MSKKTLVIVEAPNKIAKIKHILGDDYNVMASIGHIIDLDPQSMSIDIENDFAPQYTILKDKHVVVNNLRQAAKNAKEVLLASDDDAEGSFIAWSLAKELNLKNPQRIIFHEITEKEILNAVKNPIPIDTNKVNSQQTRRMLDRLIGYRISPLLWKVMNGGSLSAGRVQSVVVKLIIEKENEVNNFLASEEQSFFKVRSVFNGIYDAILIETSDKKTLKSAKITKIIDAKQILLQISQSSFKIINMIEKNSIQNPSPPFSTSSLLQEAYRKLGYSIDLTTRIAQKLYAEGLVTYIRTDSVSLSNDAHDKIEKYVTTNFGKKYYKKTLYKTKSKSAQEAHEAIRPTNFNTRHIGDKYGNQEQSVYSLIWKRAIASQMESAIFKITNVIINIDKLPTHRFLYEHEIVIFDGYLKIYGETKQANVELPQLNQLMKINDVTATQEFLAPPPRYDQASIINILDSEKGGIGIGRPSTYKSIIKKIQDVKYVKICDDDGIEKKSLMLKLSKDKIEEDTKLIHIGKNTNKFVPTELGAVVTKFLDKHFCDIMNYSFTSNMEEKLDDIASGQEKMINVLKSFYNDFDKVISKINTNDSLRDIVELGRHPILNHKIYTYVAKYGPVVQMDDDNGKKINIAPIKTKTSQFTIDDAVELFKFPKLLGKYNKKNVTLYKGQYGHYLKYGTDKLCVQNYTEDFSIDNAKLIIDEKSKKKLWECKDKTNHYIILDGPYGKYINCNKKYNYTLPKDEDVEQMTIERVNEIIKKLKTTKKKRFYKKK